MPAADDRMYSEGTVLQASPSEDGVKVLVEYGPYKERRVCAFPRELWPEDNPPQEGQKCSIEFRPDQEVPIIKVIVPLSPRPTARHQRAVRDAQDLLGIKPGDKALLIVAPNREHAARTDKIYDLGYGEGLGLREIFPLLHECGVSPRDIECLFPDEPQTRDRAQPADRHVILLGSILSNFILKEHYWNDLEISQIYSFPDRDAPQARQRLRMPTASGGTRDWVFEDLNGASGSPHIRDVFVTAVSRNLFDHSGYHRCILSFGITSIGTGYGTVVLTARRALELIADRVRPDPTERPEWHAAWQVDMRGFLDPDADPVECVWGLEDMPNPVLRKAITSPRVWSDDPEADEGEDVIVEYLRRCGRFAEE